MKSKTYVTLSSSLIQQQQRAAFGEDDDAAVYGLSSADESKEVIKAFQKMREVVSCILTLSWYR